MKLNITRKLIISLLLLSVRFASAPMMVQLEKKKKKVNHDLSPLI